MKNILLLSFFTLLLYGCGSRQETKIIRTEVPPRSEGQTDVLQLRCEPLETVRVGFIGLGGRGRAAVSRFVSIEGAQISAICDFDQDNLNKTQEIITNGNHPKAKEYTGEKGWQELCAGNEVDLIYICTDWLSHTPIAVYAMNHGKHAAIEVPAAVSIAECWELVDTAEKTRRHCMMLENCCYDRFELATLNMAQQGVFGEIVHTEGAYIHDLRPTNSNERMLKNSSDLTGYPDDYIKNWRMKYNAEHQGNPYPTHGLGPVCQILNIHRGDKMDYLISMSSDQFGITEYAKEKFGDNSPQAKQSYGLGDMNVTMIKTQKGKTIMVQHDITSPRPYSRIHLVSGTKGFAQKYPVEQIALDPNAHDALSKPQMDSILNAYEHPFYKEAGEQAAKLGAVAHGGMDYIMDYRLVYCLRKGLPLDQDVYDAAEWSSLVELTELSVKNNGAPVEIPDFTRGAWNKLNRLKFAE
ncbi:MAG TPA: acetylgalactosaminidase [Dysgonomonas sp.]|nr:acetylgalactosaminidase [Dysgonomonas sp.]